MRAGVPPHARRRSSPSPSAASSASPPTCAATSPTGSPSPRQEERQAHRVRRRGPRVAHRGQRSAPLGYDVTIFEKLRSRGLMRSNIPSFRLPEAVLDEEIGDDRANMGVNVRYERPIDEHEGPARPRGTTPSSSAAARRRARTSRSPAATTRTNVHIGIDWLESVAFGHTTKIGERCSSSASATRRWTAAAPRAASAARDIKVMARKPRGTSRPRPWELEDAEEEQVEIVVNHEPKRFVIENGVLKGMEFERYESRRKKGQAQAKVTRHGLPPRRRRHPRHRPRGAFPWIEKDVGLEFDKWGIPGRRQEDLPVDAPGVFFGGDAAWGPRTSSGRSSTAPGGDLDPQPLPGHRRHRAPGAG
jgi:formate dehydrogenase beta subunit